MTRPPRCRVLVVDDDEDAAETLSLLLQGRGHEVCMALDGRGAMAMATAFMPDAVLLDIGLPDRDGYEVARWMRRQPGLAGVVLIAQTGWAQDGDRAQSAAAGFDHHLVKPIDLEALYALLAGIGPARTDAPSAGPEVPGPGHADDDDDHGSTGR